MPPPASRCRSTSGFERRQPSLVGRFAFLFTRDLLVDGVQGVAKSRLFAFLVAREYIPV
jgi:hypothetical protein